MSTQCLPLWLIDTSTIDLEFKMSNFNYCNTSSCRFEAIIGFVLFDWLALFGTAFSYCRCWMVQIRKGCYADSSSWFICDTGYIKKKKILIGKYITVSSLPILDKASKAGRMCQDSAIPAAIRARDSALYQKVVLICS